MNMMKAYQFNSAGCSGRRRLFPRFFCYEYRSADGHHSDGVHFCYFRRSVRIGRSSSAGRPVVHYSDY